MLKQGRKYLWKITQFQIFAIAPENREKERVWGWMAGRKEKAYFCPNIHILWENTSLCSPTLQQWVHSIVFALYLLKASRQCSSSSMFVYKRHCRAGNAFQYPTTWIILKRSLFFRLNLTQWYKIIPAGALEGLNPLRIGFKREKKDTEKLFSII